jgi:Flp pilus assembly protein TadG
MKNVNRDAGLKARGSKLLASCSGQALIEWAMVLPLAFLLVVNVVNFGALAFACITVSNAARAGACYMAQGPDSLSQAGYPTQAQVTAVVQGDISSLPNHSSATVSVCSNKNGSADSTTPYNCLTPVISASTNYADPEGGTYTIGTVQVTYTYCPLIPSWTFPVLHISTSLPSCTTGVNNTITGGVTFTRIAAMRLL